MKPVQPPMKQMALDIGLAPVPTLDNFVAAGNEAVLEHPDYAAEDDATPGAPD